MQIIDNINKTVKDDLQAGIHKGSKMSVAAACFSYAALMNPAAPCCTNAARRAGIWGRCPIELYSVLCLRYTTIK